MSILLFSMAFGVQLLGLALWLQDVWRWSPLQAGLAIAPSTLMVSLTAIGLRRYIARIRPAKVAAAGGHLVAVGGTITGLSIEGQPSYLVGVLPGWLIIGVGFGFALPAIIGSATQELAPRQTSTGIAILQMNRQIGSVLGIAALVILLGSAGVSTGSVSAFIHV